MTKVRGGAAVLAGALTGALATAVAAVGDWQADLVAGGLAGNPVTPAAAVVAPARATGVAIATALLVVSLLAASGAVVTRLTVVVAWRRGYWCGLLGVAVATLAIGSLATQHRNPSELDAVLAAAGHSTLVAAIALTAMLALIITRHPQPERGRLVG